MVWKIPGSAHHTVMSNAHGSFTSMLFASSLLLLGAAGIAGCDTMNEATDARTVPDESCIIDCEPVPEPEDNCIVDCEPEPDECVMTHDRWVLKSFSAGPDQGPQATLDGELCGMSYDNILTGAKDSPWMKVAQQYVTAKVNVAHGASMPAEIAAAMDDAESFLVGCEPCPVVGLATVPSLKNLTLYNAGKIGPDECECVVDCDQCIIDCDDDDDLDECPVEFAFRAK